MDNYVAAARQALAAGDRYQAQQLLNQAMSLNPNNGEIWYLLGELAAEPGQRTMYLDQAALLGYQPDPYQSQYPPQYQGQYPPQYQGQYPPQYQGQYQPQPMYGAPPRRGPNPAIFIVLILGLFLVGAVGAVFYLGQRTLNSISGTTTLAPLGSTSKPQTSGPAAEIGTDEYIPEVEEADHIAPGTAHTYNSNPPTSGNHWSALIPWGTYLTAPPRDESIVHNLEHGGVIISFNPELVSADEQSQLEELYAELSAINPRVILTVRSNLDVPVAVTSWEYRLLLDSVDIAAVRSFYDDHIAKGPECVNGRCP